MIEAYLNHAQALRRGRQTGTAEVLYEKEEGFSVTSLRVFKGNEKCLVYERFVKEFAVELKESDNKHLVASEVSAPRGW